MHKVIPIQPADAWIAGEKIHARSVTGTFARWRWTFVWLTQAFFYGVPWLTWNARQAVLFDIDAKRFYLFEAVLFPQDLIYLAALLVISALLLFFATAVVGRVWCGFACPQTVYTSIFMWIENRFEGSHQHRKRLDSTAWGTEKVLRRGGKHIAWILFASWTGFTFVGYFTSIRPLAADAMAMSVGPWTTCWTLVYGSFTYLNAALVREKVCLHMCPYGRFQGSLMDECTLNVAYDHRRGEPRRGSLVDDRRGTTDGHCIGCTLCVQVCPTGIDIRQGLQAACIGCGLCIDACDDVMRKVQAPLGLIRMASLHELDEVNSTHRPFWRRVLRTRVWVYGSLLTLVIAATVAAFSSRSEVRMDVIRDRSVMTRQVAQGAVENVYTLLMMNATDQAREVLVHVEPSSLVSLQQPIFVKLGPAQAATVTATVRMPANEVVRHAGEVVRIRFVGASPQDGSHPEAAEPSTFLVPN